ncbi:MAG: metal-dependent transcriptional regulator [Actinomycetota bacterium]|nr:metal-dependent transcriptional regulator [Actinomycetota bacterium]
MRRESFEKYIDVIYELSGKKGGARITDIAKALGISPPSVSEMVDHLVEIGLVTHDKYKHISLTPKGKRLGKGLDRKHEALKKFFIDILGVDEKIADRDACEIEHVISKETLERMLSYLESISSKD